MTTPFEQQYALSIHGQHFGKASKLARLIYGSMLILISIIMILSSSLPKVSPKADKVQSTAFISGSSSHFFESEQRFSINF